MPNKPFELFAWAYKHGCRELGPHNRIEWKIKRGMDKLSKFHKRAILFGISPAYHNRNNIDDSARKLMKMKGE